MSDNRELDAILDAAQIHVEAAQKNLATTAPIVVSENKSEEDFDFARKNLQDLIKTGNIALEELTRFARESGHPRAYEVIGGMIKNLTDANKQLLDLHKQINDVGGKTKQPGKSVTNNSIFVGTNAQLNEYIKKITGAPK